MVMPNLVMAELTLYRCDPEGRTDGDPNEIKSVNKMAQNAKECNSSCKKTNRTIKTKINERTNKILVEEYENGMFKASTMYESSKATFNVKGEPIKAGDTVQIFDKENFSPWAIESLTGDFIEIDSDIYSKQELLEIAAGIGLDTNVKLTIKGKEIIRSN